MTTNRFGRKVSRREMLRTSVAATATLAAGATLMPRISFAAEKVVKIGFLAPLTGDVAAWAANRGEALTLEKKHDDVRLAISLRPERNRFLGRQVNGHHRSRTRIENGARPSAHRSVFNHAGDGQRSLATFDAALLNLDLGSRFAANEAVGRNDPTETELRRQHLTLKIANESVFRSLWNRSQLLKFH